MLVGKLDILLVTKTAQMEKGLKKGGTLAQRFTRSISRATKQLIGFGSASVAVYTVARALNAAVAAADEFNAAMAKSTAIMGGMEGLDLATKAQMALVAQRTAVGSAFGPEKVAEAYFYLASAGMDAKQSMEVLAPAVRFAQAGAFDLATAVDLVTDAQSALGLATDDSQQNMVNFIRVSDALVGANTLANASVQQFSESLTRKAAAALRFLGKDIEETVAILAVFADQGTKGADAGTALAIVVRELTDKALENTAAFEKHKVAVFDDAGGMRTAAQILQDLETELDGMSTRLKIATLKEMGFTAKSRIFIQTLLDTSEKIREYNRRLDEMGGITEVVAKRTMTQWAELKSRIGGSIKAINANLTGIPMEMFAKGWNTQLESIYDLFEKLTLKFAAWLTRFEALMNMTERLAGWVGIDLGIDDAAITQVDDLADAVDGLGKNLRDLDPAAEAAEKSLTTLLDRLERQAATFGMTDLEQQAAKLEELTTEVTDPEGDKWKRGSDLLTKLEGLQTGQDITAKFDAMLADLQRQVSTFGLDDIQQARQELLELAIRGLDPTRWAVARDAINELQAKQFGQTLKESWDAAATAGQELRISRMAELERFTQQFETPQERFGRVTEDIAGRIAEGLDLETAGRALTAGILSRDAALRRDYQPPLGAAAVTQGTQAAFALEMQKRIKDIDEKQLRAQEEANDILEDIRGNLENAGLTEAPIGT